MAENGKHALDGRTLYLHPMTRSGALLIAAAFRSIGIDARVCPPSDDHTLELGNRYSSGEECYPEKITIGDYLKITEQPGFDPARTAFLMPTANGPCRFGQYRQLFRAILDRIGLAEVPVISPSSKNGYAEIGGTSIAFFRATWLGVVAADILRKYLLMTRPYERVAGSAEVIYERSLEHAGRVLEVRGTGLAAKRGRLAEVLRKARDQFRTLDCAPRGTRPRIGIVGEIFCRHNRFANDNLIKKLEEHGAETWLADVGEWITYTDWSRMDNLKRQGKRFSGAMAGALLKQAVMRYDEHALSSLFHEDFSGYEEPSDTREIVRLGAPYLPAWGALGEMALSLGRAAYLHDKGIDGIIDISPFSCMNGVVSEAVYPSFSRDHDALPCRVFYFDGAITHLDRDIGIFMELVHGYRRRKNKGPMNERGIA